MMADTPVDTRYDGYLALLRFFLGAAKSENSIEIQRTWAKAYGQVCKVLGGFTFGPSDVYLLPDLDTLRCEANTPLTRDVTAGLMQKISAVIPTTSGEDRWLTWCIELERIAAQYEAAGDESADEPRRRDLRNSWKNVCQRISQSNVAPTERTRLVLRLSGKLPQGSALSSETRELLRQLQAT